jgi:hypothetical protein
MTITPVLLDQLLANYQKPEDLTWDAVALCVGIRCGAVSSDMRLSCQAARPS